MRTTIEIDDTKVKAALEFHQGLNKTQLIDLALTEMIRLGKSRQLARLAGKYPELRDIPRRKF